MRSRRRLSLFSNAFSLTQKALGGVGIACFFNLAGCGSSGVKLDLEQERTSKKFAPVDEQMRKALVDSVFPGAVLLVSHKNRIRHFKAYGFLGYGEYKKETPLNAIFDLASVTKVVATTTAAMLLVDRGKLDLEKPVQSYLPEFQGEGKLEITVRDLLVHTSGLPPFKRYYLENLSSEETLQRIFSEPLEYERRSESRYSDLGIILTGKIIEKISGMPLDQFCAKNIFEPLGMKETFFNPPKQSLYRIPPTELDEWRDRLVHGEVHDENSFSLGGVAGHAGLFSTATDVAAFLKMMVNAGEYKGRNFILSQTIAAFTKRQNLVEESTRAIGWDTRSEERSSSGHFMSMRAFGHTGYTGTSIWVDPDKSLFVILLTNRVHPTRVNRKIIAFRPILHDAVMRALKFAPKTSGDSP